MKRPSIWLPLTIAFAVSLMLMIVLAIVHACASGAATALRLLPQ